MDNHQFRDCKRPDGTSEAFDDTCIVSLSSPTAGLRQKTPQIRHAHHFATSRPTMNKQGNVCNLTAKQFQKPPP
ncbi:hypothetical protein WH297_01180 [Ochrobactrum vermis]|uniref:Uncharacterized protein n=1 Tax=Ochrobactrum vermis TaxID=1827297 RepID=A0ABU8P9P3_9HYPH|nr:hypothetical protein [Ochrobactrum vermis]